MSLKDAMTRTPVTYAEMVLDFCGRTFGVAPCLATGTPCYNTYPTCKYKGAFLRTEKVFEFSSNAAPLPWPGPRPYLKEVRYLATEIKDSLTVNGRVTLSLLDEPDGDVGIDPYVLQRASVQGTYFRKLLARNKNYKGRMVRVYEGFLGETKEQFAKKWAGKIDNITIDKGVCKIEVVDLLKDLDKTEIPAKLDLKLLVAIDADDTELTLAPSDDIAKLAATGYIRLGDEVIEYAAIDTPTNRLTGLTREAFGTTAALHSAKDKVQPCIYFPPINPFDLLTDLLKVHGGLAAEDVDSAEIDYWRDWPGGEVPFTALLTESVKLKKLYFEILDLIDCKSWVNEDFKVTIRRNLPNEPGRVYRAITDEAHIVADSAGVDLNDKSRLTRIILEWDRAVLVKEAGEESTSDYARGNVVVDVGAESPEEYNEQLPKNIASRWLKSAVVQDEVMEGFIRDLCLRRLMNQRDAQPVLQCRVELKDSDVRTGEYCIVTTDEIVSPDGTPATGRYQVVKRDPRGDDLTLKLQKVTDDSVCFIAPDATPAWDAASDEQKEYGFIDDDDGLIDGRPGYLIY